MLVQDLKILDEEVGGIGAHGNVGVVMAWFLGVVGVVLTTDEQRLGVDLHGVCLPCCTTAGCCEEVKHSCAAFARNARGVVAERNAFFDARHFTFFGVVHERIHAEGQDRAQFAHGGTGVRQGVEQRGVARYFASVAACNALGLGIDEYIDGAFEHTDRRGGHRAVEQLTEGDAVQRRGIFFVAWAIAFEAVGKTVGSVLWNEHWLVDDDVVRRGAAQTRNVPVLLDVVFALLHQEGAHIWALPFFFGRNKRAEEYPVAMVATRREAPAAAEHITALGVLHFAYGHVRR